MNKKYLGLGSLILTLVVILGLMITGWTPNQSTRDKPIRVVTSLNFYGEVAQQVAGKYGDVTSFIDSSAVDTHDYQPSTKQAVQLAKANVVIENGLGYDQWLSQMVSSNGADLRVINVGKQVAGKISGDNEHVWYAPNTMVKLTRLLAKQYGKIDPSHKEYYQQNAQKYENKLVKLNHTIAKAKAGVNANKRNVAVSEPVFDYALGNLGYKITDQHFAKAIEDDNDPSPHDIASLQRSMENHQIAFFVNNEQEEGTTVRNILKVAHKNHIPVLNVTETKPAKMTYIEWIQSEYQELIKIQESGE